MNSFNPIEKQKSVVIHSLRTPWQFLMIILGLTWFFWLLASKEFFYTVVFHYLGGVMSLRRLSVAG